MKFDDQAFSFEGQKLTPWPFVALVAIEVLLGIGGALAVTLLVTWVNKFPKADDTQNVLWLFSLYVVAGFAGRRILPMVSRRLEQKLEEATRIAYEADKKSREAKKQVREVDVLTRALDSLTDPEKPAYERQTLILELESVLEADRTNRKAAIVLGRLHEESPQLEADDAKRLRAAVKVLSGFLGAEKAAGMQDVDYAAALYNRAGYRIRLAEKIGDLSEQEAGYKDLENSVRLDPGNADEARSDPDFELVRVRDEDRFQKITARSDLSRSKP